MDICPPNPPTLRQAQDKPWGELVLPQDWGPGGIELPPELGGLGGWGG